MTLQCPANFLHFLQSENIGSPDGDPISLIAFMVVENSKYSFAGTVIFFQTSIYLLHVFDRGSEFILLMGPFCIKSKTFFRVTYSELIC